MIPIEAHAEGLILLVRAQPGAKRSGLVGLQAGALKVAVTQPPEKGKANKAIVQVLADALGLRKSQIELLSGETSGHKKFLIRGVDGPALTARIGQALGAER